jgi:hypothetical protein
VAVRIRERADSLLNTNVGLCEIYITFTTIPSDPGRGACRRSTVLIRRRRLALRAHKYAPIPLEPGRPPSPSRRDISDRLPQVSARSEDCSALTVSEDLSDVSSSDSEPNSFVPDSLSQEENLFVPGSFPGTSELDAIKTGVQQLGLASFPDSPFVWPSQGPALSEYSTTDLFTMAFPSLFPFGKADFSTPRRQKLDLYEWAKHLMRYKDARFATHPRFRFFALNLIFRHRAMSRGPWQVSFRTRHRPSKHDRRSA